MSPVTLVLAALVLFGVGPLLLADPSAAPGLAARYPGGVGIEKDPAVVFADNFESGNLNRWDGGYARDRAHFVHEPGDVHSGTSALQWVLPKGDSGGNIAKWLQPGYDALYARVYWKLGEDWDVAAMHGWGISAAAPGINVPGDAGKRADGRNKFCAILDSPHTNLSCYVYHPEQKGLFGDHFKSGVTLEPGRWYCVELMQKANTPGRRDGELALWLDGREVGRWQELRFRDVPELKLNKVFLTLYIHQNDRGENRCCYDDLVVATQYIGPQVPAAPAAGRQVMQRIMAQGGKA
jgi:hypothetical protein